MSANKLISKRVLNILREILFLRANFFPMGAKNPIGGVKFPKGFFPLSTGIFNFFKGNYIFQMFNRI